MKHLLTVLGLLISSNLLAQYGGWYDVDVRTLVGNKAKEDSLIAWYNRSKPSEPSVITLYGATSVLSNPALPAFLIKCHTNNLYAGFAYTADSEVNSIIAYNNSQRDMRAKFRCGKTEMEPYRYDPNKDGVITSEEVRQGNARFITLLTTNGPKLWQNNMLSMVYIGWHNDSLYKYIIQHSDQVSIHAYRTTTQMLTPGDAFYYTQSRLDKMSLAAQALKKVMNVSILFSVEQSFGFNYFSTRASNKPFPEAYKMFWDKYSASATPAMRTWLRPQWSYYFKSDLGRQARP